MTIRIFAALSLLYSLDTSGQDTIVQPVLVQPAGSTQTAPPPPPAAPAPVTTTPATAPAAVTPPPGTTTTTTTTTPAAAPAAATAPVYVAADEELKFHFGFKFAPTMAWLKPDTKGLDRDGSKLGFSYGIVTEFNFQKNYAFVTGLQVTYRGGLLTYQYSDNALYPEFDYNLNLQFIEIPIAIKMKTNEFGKVRYFGQFGLVPGFLINAKVDEDLVTHGTGGGYTIDTEYEDDFKESINDFNLSMQIAAGMEYKLSGSTVLFGSIEFNNGFVDILGEVQQPIVDDDPNNPPPRDVKWTAVSNYFAINLGILF